MHTMLENKQLVLDVAKGNPGAVVVIGLLAEHPRWFMLMHHLRRSDTTGERLWERYAEEFRGNVDALAKALERELDANRSARTRSVRVRKPGRRGLGPSSRLHGSVGGGN